MIDYGVYSFPLNFHIQWGKIAFAVTVFFAVFSFAGSADATNTGDVFKTTATDLSVGTNYTVTITPTAATTTDVQFSGSYNSTTLTINGTALSFGTLNDLDTPQSLIVSNANATAGSITLNTAANSTTGSNASDLLVCRVGIKPHHPEWRRYFDSQYRRYGKY